MKRRILIVVTCIFICTAYVFMGVLTEQMNKKNYFTFLKLRPVHNIK